MKTTTNERRETPAQRNAIESNADKILVLAGPGSGKTATSIARIDRLLRNGVPATRIAALTFTNAAAKETESRVKAILAEDPSEPGFHLGYCGTLHGFALRCLKKYGGAAGYGDRMAVVNPEGSAALLESKNRQMTRGGVPIKKLLELKAAGRPARPTKPEELVVASYFDEIRDAGLVDFDVLLTEFARLLENDRDFAAAIADEFEYLFDDEAQDHALVDWRILRALSIRNKFLVGDPDQSIYSFRGAALGETLACAADPTWTVIKLEENFRSHEKITSTAQRLIEHNTGRVAKRTVSAIGAGGLVWTRPADNAGDEVGKIAMAIKLELAAARKPEVIAVLTRTNAIAAQYAKELEALGIPVAKRVAANVPPDLPFIRSLVTYLCNPENDTLGYLFTVARQAHIGVPESTAKASAHELRTKAYQERRSINGLAYGFPKNLTPHSVVTAGLLASNYVSSEGTMFVAEKLRELPDGAPMVELAHALISDFRDADEKVVAGEGVKVITIHAAKGREFDVVFLAAFEDEAIPGRRKDVDVEEERRLAYVGITRARRVVHFTWARTRETQWQGIQPRTPSRFIEEATK